MKIWNLANIGCHFSSPTPIPTDTLGRDKTKFMLFSSHSYFMKINSNDLKLKVYNLSYYFLFVCTIVFGSGSGLQSGSGSGSGING